MGKLLEVAVVAKRLNVCDDTVRNLIGDPRNALVYVRVGKRAIRICEDSLNKYIEERTYGKDRFE
jgi:excisionase family DNA binding protein